MASGEDSTGGVGKKRSFGEWLVFLLPVMTAAAAGIWAVVTWLYPHAPVQKAPAPSPVLAAPAATKPPTTAVSASDQSVAIGGGVSGSTIVNGEGADGAPVKR